MSAASELLQRIRNTEARIGIIGLGYVGLPLAVEFARAGFDVTGFDVDDAKNQQISAGNSYIPDKPYASNQFTNGDVWVKPFADALGLAAFGQPLHLGGGDFAFGGASMTTDGQGLPPSLKAQETMFLSGAGGVPSYFTVPEIEPPSVTATAS